MSKDLLAFSNASGESFSINEGRIRLKQFQAVLSHSSDWNGYEDEGEALFRSLDLDGDGLLSLTEATGGLALLVRGSLLRRGSVAMRLYRGVHGGEEVLEEGVKAEVRNGLRSSEGPSPNPNPDWRSRSDSRRCGPCLSVWRVLCTRHHRVS